MQKINFLVRHKRQQENKNFKNYNKNKTLKQTKNK